MSPDLNARERACVERVLTSAKLAYLAMVESPGRGASPRRDGDPSPYVTPMNFAYEPPAGDSNAAGGCASGGPEGRLLLHTGPGRKVDALKRNPRVCISVTSEEQFKLGATPCEDGYLYQSVILEGRAELLTDESERDAALRAIVAKYDPEAIDKPFDQRIFAQTLLYEVHIDVIGFKERPKQGR